MSSWVDQLLEIEEAPKRQSLLKSLSADAPEQIHAALLAALYTNPPRAAQLAGIGREFADLHPGAEAQAFASRCEGHVAYAGGEYERAAACYEIAINLFDRSGAEMESARTLSSGLQTLILLGRYDAAKAWADRAGKIFRKHGDVLRLARLDSNAGNIFFRLDQPRDAILRYQRALQTLESMGDAKDVAAVLSNLAVCHTSLGKFAEALSCYQRARQVCEENHLAPLAAQADYNIAYLYHLRGDYLKARAHYGLLREQCLERGDAYHAALCDLDEAELDLELNLTHDGEILARRAESGLAALGMRYERAKALVNLAVAGSQRGDRKFASRMLTKARKLFEEEGNRTWTSMVDLLRAVLAFHDHRFEAARKLGNSAWRVLATTPLPGRAAYCQILLARLWLQGGQAERARVVARTALERLGEDCSPSLRFHANLVEGEACEVLGCPDQAQQAYEAARHEIESLRGRVDTEDLRISILKDKLSVYDALVSLCLDSALAQDVSNAGRAMLLVQEAKSRSLADRLNDSFVPMDVPDSPEYESLRKDLNWCYRQIELAAMLDRAGLPSGAANLRARTRELEGELQRQHTTPLIGAAQKSAASVAYLQAGVPAGCCLLEYFEARGNLYVFLLNKSELEVVPLGPSAPVRRKLKLLQFQLAICGLGEPGGADASLPATNHHLRELYRLLLAPFEGALSSYRHLIVAPYRHLHGLPFAALNDGERCLIDRFTISTNPSASVYAGCRSRTRPKTHGSVVMAISDRRAPQIAAEGELVASLLPEARLVSGSDATREVLQNCSGSRILHLATHGSFRRDNALFSSLQLADGHLNLIDLQRADLKVDLITLSACHSGSAVAVGGDEMQGLMRGFLAAGAQNLLASLWEIDDASTKEFMRSFYTSVAEGVSFEGALRQATLDVRAQYPHPFHWAPFVLAGASP